MLLIVLLLQLFLWLFRPDFDFSSLFLQNQTAVTVEFSSKQLLLFVFAVYVIQRQIAIADHFL